MEWQHEPDDWCQVTLKTDTGCILPGSITFKELASVEIVESFSRPSDWRNDYEHTLDLFKAVLVGTNEPVYGIYEHIPDGYSSYTYEPDSVLECCLTSDIEVAKNQLFTNDWR